LKRANSSSSSPLLTWLWCSSVVSYPLTAAATFLDCSCSLTHTGKKTHQPLDANLDQRFIRVGLTMLKLGCQHTSMWRDMAQQKWHEFPLLAAYHPWLQGISAGWDGKTDEESRSDRSELGENETTIRRSSRCSISWYS
jgi:hypothetical protein